MRKFSVKFRWVSLAVAFVLIVGAGNLAYSAKPDKDNVLRVKVFADFSTFDIIQTGGGGPFYVGGTIVDPESNDAFLGEFQCWGFFFAGGARGMVTQEFNIGDRGKIILTGEEDEGIRPIVGGTGDFKNVRGDAFVDFSNPGFFLVDFNLIGAEANP